MTNYIKYLLLASGALLTSCSTEIQETETAEAEEQYHEAASVTLTAKQMETIGLETGGLSSIKLNGFVKASGMLGLPPNAYSSVTAKAAGIIKGNNKYIEGNYLKKGVVIAYIENPDFIIKQQEYLETKALLKLKTLEKERQKTLYDAAAGVSRTLENAEAEVEMLEAKSMSLAKQLAYLGIPIDKLTPNNINQRIPLIAPMSGYITKINMHNGMYADATASLMEIVANDHLHLELDVFEKDIADIKIGQEISYTVPAIGNQTYDGEVSVIGKEFDQEKKTVRVHGHLHGDQPPFIKDLFINAQIWLNDKTVDALPEGAILKDGDSSFIYLLGSKDEEGTASFDKLAVIPGAMNKGFVSVKFIDALPENASIVTKGAYYILAQSKKGELLE
ncbi:efflux RND transporter periplasmic adaptor subunit [Arcticibacterium luteifluviistationis]|uniref:Efflux transporter periplasmic adaptor subunit n=1 Tax=Arcticibacterium luteifluviistationis TaxID=1784714 RepID=A0A2Z4GBH3_9BACT|nr:efflux RND transporter periplasmic adaptor subunit [Arcticibacterium luteifluviistationis]AWV98547.1 efflux transporter periplasmic adaptor subunit [Arcticibacterium luteifluviistationis]